MGLNSYNRPNLLLLVSNIIKYFLLLGYYQNDSTRHCVWQWLTVYLVWTCKLLYSVVQSEPFSDRSSTILIALQDCKKTAMLYVSFFAEYWVLISPVFLPAGIHFHFTFSISNRDMQDRCETSIFRCVSIVCIAAALIDNPAEEYKLFPMVKQSWVLGRYR